MKSLTDFRIHSTSTYLQSRKAYLLEADGGVQKYRSVIRALVRMDKEKIDPNQINEDSKPSDVLKYIANQVELTQTHEERPEQIEKVIKRLKKLVRNDNVSIELVKLHFFLRLSLTSSCSCCNINEGHPDLSMLYEGLPKRR